MQIKNIVTHIVGKPHYEQYQLATSFFRFSNCVFRNIRDTIYPVRILIRNKAADEIQRNIQQDH